jgi:hypothetical protein
MAFQVKTPGVVVSGICAVEKVGRLWKVSRIDREDMGQTYEVNGVVENLQKQATKGVINRVRKIFP